MRGDPSFHGRSLLAGLNIWRAGGQQKPTPVCRLCTQLPTEEGHLAGAFLGKQHGGWGFKPPPASHEAQRKIQAPTSLLSQLSASPGCSPPRAPIQGCPTTLFHTAQRLLQRHHTDNFLNLFLLTPCHEPAVRL